ncbi:hypothetical protein F4808DRAFT_458140 [Astrocystis sublimbata]|nr:hypothetical protein F4808DRAFT_458140 [Astrocystis sublimbata]
MATHLFLIAIVLLEILGIVPGVSAATTLFNGAQQAIFQDASSTCLTAFNLSLACDPSVQLLSYDLDRLEFTQDSLETLCMPSCLSSLQSLETAVSSSCGTYDIDFDGAFLSAVQVVDLFMYKYKMSCLADSQGKFCLEVEKTWNISSLNTSGAATWPAHTNKTFPNFNFSPDGTPQDDVDGNIVDNSSPVGAFEDFGIKYELTGQDYYQKIDLDDSYADHGWPEPLEYDEYPLELQCSECFLGQYRLGIESQWGEVFDEVSDQVWNNVRQNCDLDWDLVPSHNLSTWATNINADLVWTYAPTCSRKIVQVAAADGTIASANDVARANNIPTAALVGLNSVSWNSVPAGEYCAPEACQVALINATTDALSFVAALGAGGGVVSETQFWEWNNFMDSKNLIVGEVVCVGQASWGCVYSSVGVIPPSTTTSTSIGTSTTTSSTMTTSTTPTSTFIPAPAPTVTGTTGKCYKWYVVKSGDGCWNIDQAYGITLDYFRTLNTYVDEACSNIWPGYAYCVSGIASG